MSQKRTIPFEPEELPVQPKKPEVQQPHDPGVAPTPEEAPDNFPQELPPDTMQQPEIKPE